MNQAYIIESLIRWWGDLSYTVWMYFALFLPVTALIYHFTVKDKRKYVLLIFSWIFFFSLSRLLLFANIGASVFVWILGIRIDRINTDKSIKRKERKKRKKRVLVAGIIALLLILVAFKYLDFIGLNIVRVTWRMGIPFDWKLLNLIAPVG
ncbi:MAG: hypothetical protein J5966_00285, partial [Lachnospiraceae bacterium]|nr:hypothetical protein [Lachnospiraceae bacterium]